MAAGGRHVPAGAGMLRQYSISTRWLQAQRRMVGMPIVDRAGSDGATQSPGRAPLNVVKSAMAGVGVGAGVDLRPAACTGAIKAAHSAHAPANNWIA
jgi:hypothetical protein